MHQIDWAIVACLLVMVAVIALWARRYNRSVADFMVGNRCAGRYMLAVANGMGWFGAITIMAAWQRNYESGFTGEWWRMLNFSVAMLITMTGFVVYRYRQTRVMTLAQFFQVRYSRNFRIFAGMVCFISGVVNFGVFPLVSATFFIYFCDLPTTFLLMGMTIPTLAPVMLVLLTIAVLCSWMGGQIAVMLTDFFQGIFAYIAIAVILIFCFITVDWTAIGEAAKMAPAGKSIINPFDTAKHETFTWYYFLIMIVIFAYGTGSWQGTAGYNAAARSPHEQRMAVVMGIWRIISLDTLLLFGAVAVFTVMHTGGFSAYAAKTQAIVDTIDNESIRSLMMVPIGMAQILPVGLKGLLAAMVMAACISTLDTYLHSWGTMFIQDVIMPWRTKPFEPKQHMLLLRIAIICVAIWSFFFSLFFELDEALTLFFTITGAIFLGGSGAAIIGGLYWKRGRTIGAFGGLIVGSTLAVTSIVVRQLWPGHIIPRLQQWYPDWQWLADHAKEPPISSFWMSVIVAILSISTYVVLSLLKKETFNIDRMLHKGKYAIKTEGEPVQQDIPADTAAGESWFKKALRKFGLTEHFTFADKCIFGATISWSLGWGIVFLGGTAWYLTKGIDDSVWLAFWKVKMWIMFALVLVVASVFTIGGMIDLKAMIKALKTIRRDDSDDGMVIGRVNRDEADSSQDAPDE